jgi:ribosome biogenesis GTPase
VEHRGAYELLGPHGPLKAAVDTQLREEATDSRDFPAVGDWVVHSLDARHDRRVLITSIEERTSAVLRKAPGHEPVPQVVAANVDVLCVVTTAGEDLDDRRLERYLVTAFGSGARPLVVLNKSDLLPTTATDRARVQALAPSVEVIVTSAANGEGMGPLGALLADNHTLAFIGSSGVGKSSLVNQLIGSDVLEIGAVKSDGSGRHTTIRRQLLLAPGGGVVIDTPGLREVRLWDDGGLALAFPEVTAAGEGCRFADCRHRGEPGCAVEDAVGRGHIAAIRLEGYRDLAVELDELGAEREEHERMQRRRRDARARKGRRPRGG